MALRMGGKRGEYSVRCFYDGNARLLCRPDEGRPNVFRREIADNRIQARLDGLEILFAVVYGPVAQERARGVPHRVNNGVMASPIEAKPTGRKCAVCFTLLQLFPISVELMGTMQFACRW